MVEINGNNIQFIQFNIIKKNQGNVFKNKYFYFKEDAESVDDEIFLSEIIEIFLNYKNDSRNIEIHILCDCIVINCFYINVFSQNGGYCRSIKNYLKLMNEIDKQYDEYKKIIK